MTRKERSRMTPDRQTPLFIEDDNLSRAWSRAFLHICDHPGTTIQPLVVSLTGFTALGDVAEDVAVRSALDTCLRATGKRDIEAVAWAIFPQNLWRFAQTDRHRLFDLYKETYPRFRELNLAQNGRGLYFERLVAFGSGPIDGNQLEWIISQYLGRPGVRRSMLQAAIFDPARDHVADAQLGFPCLQQVSFVPDENSLTLNAFYATQQLYDKAYGNWLGLCRLGIFMAHEMGLTFTRLNCVSGIEKLERISKTAPSLSPVIEAARSCVSARTLVESGTRS